jgi:hypothetical protein
MTCTVKLTVQGQARETRVFSLRGAHLVAMFSRTYNAAAFRVWVLDVLDAEVADKITISPAQAQELRELVQLVAESGVQGHGETWNRLHRKFHVNSYLQLPGGMFTAAVAYLKGKMDGQSLKALAVKHFPELAARDTIDAGREALASAYVGFTKLETAIFAAKEQIMLDLMGMNDLMLDARLSIR